MPNGDHSGMMARNVHGHVHKQYLEGMPQRARHENTKTPSHSVAINVCDCPMDSPFRAAHQRDEGGVRGRGDGADPL